jgi:cyclohexanone monooxygenase
MGIEQHIDWITRAMQYMRQNGFDRIDADEPAERSWMQHVQDLVSRTLYLKAKSWYVGANVPGKAQVFLPYLGGHGNYRNKCDAVAAAGYEGFSLAHTAEDSTKKSAQGSTAQAGLEGGAI